jgi:hypothetical protein
MAPHNQGWDREFRHPIATVLSESRLEIPSGAGQTEPFPVSFLAEKHLREWLMTCHSLPESKPGEPSPFWGIGIGLG